MNNWIILIGVCVSNYVCLVTHFELQNSRQKYCLFTPFIWKKLASKLNNSLSKLGSITIQIQKKGGQQTWLIISVSVTIFRVILCFCALSLLSPKELVVMRRNICTRWNTHAVSSSPYIALKKSISSLKCLAAASSHFDLPCSQWVYHKL